MSNGTSEPWEKSDHPLFLHHSDQPGAVLVSQPLMEDNFQSWQNSMMMALTIKNKAGFVDGSLPKPTNKPVEESQWERCNVLVKTWLLGSMSKEISISVVHCKDARGIWLELLDRFSPSNIISLFNIEKQIHECEQGSDSVSTYFTKLKSLWDDKDDLIILRPCSCDAASDFHEFMNNQKTMKFLMGPRSEYEQIRGSIIGLETFPEPNKAYSMVLRHEQQAKISKPSVPLEASAFSVKRPRNTPDGKYCEKCNLNNHNTKHCRAHLTCTFCNNKGYTIDYCRKRKRTLEAGQQTSGVNNTNALPPAQSSPPDYQQVLDLLRRMNLPELATQQTSSSNESVQHASANNVAGSWSNNQDEDPCTSNYNHNYEVT